MKKNYINHILAIALTILLSACNMAEIDTAVSDDLIELPIRFTGEVSVSESLLTRSGSSNDLYGIQVYQNGEPYAYGLYDDISKMSIYLHSGHSYSFIVQAVKNGKETMSSMSSGDYAYEPIGDERWDGDSYSGFFYCTSFSILNLRHFGSDVYSGDGYGLPFCLNSRRYSYTGYGAYVIRQHNNKDVYSFRGMYSRLNTYDYKLPDEVYPTMIISNCFVYDDAQTICVSSSTIQADSPLTADRYYGESSFQVSRDINSLSIDLKHIVYGIQCNVTGVSDGTASITITNGNNTLFYKSDISGDFHSDAMIFAFSDLHAAYEYADNYTENITVSMKWMRGIGIEQNLGSQVIQVKRNANNVINIALDTD